MDQGAQSDMPPPAICESRGCPALCADCAVRSLGVCAALDPEELFELAALAQTVRFEPRGVLLAQGEPSLHIFNVTSGVMRLYRLSSDGRRQIIGFSLPGDFLGLAANGVNTFTAEAVVAGGACRFQRTEFNAIVAAKPQLLTRLYEMATHELTLAQDQMVLLGRRTAEEKVAAFLLSMRDRWARVIQAQVWVPLPMSRQDIGDFLGLTVETVSRMMTKLARDKIIVITPDGVRLLAPQRLEALRGA